LEVEGAAKRQVVEENMEVVADKDMNDMHLCVGMYRVGQLK